MLHSEIGAGKALEAMSPAHQHSPPLPHVNNHRQTRAIVKKKKKLLTILKPSIPVVLSRAGANASRDRADVTGVAIGKGSPTSGLGITSNAAIAVYSRVCGWRTGGRGKCGVGGEE